MPTAVHKRNSWRDIPLSRRALTDHAFTAFSVGSTGLVLAAALSLLVFLLKKGAQSLSLHFFTHGPAPVGVAGGGMAHALAGSAMIVGVASLMGVPLGIGAGIYLAEFARHRFLDRTLRLIADVLTGVPSIIVGVVVYAWMVAQQGHFSGFAGSVALALLIVPAVTRTTEEMLHTVPQALREGAWGLGISRWRTVLAISLRTALPGILTGCLLAFARVAGETAPLLFTAFGNQFLSWRLNGPMAALPLQIFVYAMSPYEEWHRLAWGAALILLATIAAALGLVRFAVSRGFSRERN